MSLIREYAKLERAGADTKTLNRAMKKAIAGLGPKSAAGGDGGGSRPPKPKPKPAARARTAPTRPRPQAVAPSSREDMVAQIIEQMDPDRKRTLSAYAANAGLTLYAYMTKRLEVSASHPLRSHADGDDDDDDDDSDNPDPDEPDDDDDDDDDDPMAASPSASKSHRMHEQLRAEGRGEKLNWVLRGEQGAHPSLADSKAEGESAKAKALKKIFERTGPR